VTDRQNSIPVLQQCHSKDVMQYCNITTATLPYCCTSKATSTSCRWHSMMFWPHVLAVPTSYIEASLVADLSVDQ